MAEPPLLVLDGIVSGYGGGVVIDGVSLAIGAGEAVALLGRNGVGKSTLLRTIMGIVPPRAGSIRLSGREIAGAEPFQVARAGIGYVPQGRQVFVDLTVDENLIAGNLSARNADPAYAMFPALADRRTDRAGSLSGGVQQQLAIARALMSRPRLLLLDEPSEGIQPSVIAELTDTLKRIAADGGPALLLVEQNIDMVLALCDRALFLDRGRIVEEAATPALAADPAAIDRHVGL